MLDRKMDVAMKFLNLTLFTLLTLVRNTKSLFTTSLFVSIKYYIQRCSLWIFSTMRYESKTHSQVRISVYSVYDKVLGIQLKESGNCILRHEMWGHAD